MNNPELDSCYDWWKSLTDEEQQEIMIDWYPTQVNEDVNIDKMFGDMTDKCQLEIYREEISKYVCGFCIYYNSFPCNCMIHPKYGELVEQDTCNDWEGE